ncbi:hypothetical protein D3C72_1615440 [compost metagenome]
MLDGYEVSLRLNGRRKITKINLKRAIKTKKPSPKKKMAHRDANFLLFFGHFKFCSSVFGPAFRVIFFLAFNHDLVRGYWHRLAISFRSHP